MGLDKVFALSQLIKVKCFLTPLSQSKYHFKALLNSSQIHIKTDDKIKL